MKISQNISLCSYLYLKQKCNCFLILFYKLREQKGETHSLCMEGLVGTSGNGGVSWKMGSSVSTVQKYVHMYVNAKMIMIKTRSRGRWG
jgi:hypothetical protein